MTHGTLSFCMKINREDSERSIYPKTHRSDYNIEKVWNTVCVDRAKKSNSLIIQSVTGGTDQTSGECSLGQTIPI